MKTTIKFLAIALMAFSVSSCRDYSREQDRLDKESEGKGDLLKAESTKKVKIEQAKADLESAKLDALTKVTEAQANAQTAIINAETASKTKVINAKAYAEALLLQSESQAKANEMINRSLTPTLIDYYKVEKWDGKLPTTSLGQGSNSIINLK